MKAAARSERNMPFLFGKNRAGTAHIPVPNSRTDRAIFSIKNSKTEEKTTNIIAISFQEKHIT
ncbi:hypothetical protein [Luteithermobacter gelatinilyticus]|uniref:hypothetical protein n=1 Tax=Luteithermobacter gelatinilyticus TaxID=2582913 RepID=UPI00143CDB9D|nr:hypothetical protein [Luteithermobacter gelatinilyticus]